jgi:predicted dehydrogenase
MSQTNVVRYAVVGLGNIAQLAVLPAFAHAKENSQLVALVSSDKEKLGALAKKYDVAHTGSYDELESVLQASKAQAIYIALPNTMHRRMTERAAAVGMHVLCEKPMATSVEDCEAMIAATSASHVRLMIAYRLHFEEANLDAIDRIQKGDIGEPRIFTSVFTQQVREGDIRTQRRLGGGALFDMGIYCVNAARYLLRDEPVEVLASEIRDTAPRFQGVDESTTAVLSFGGGRIAQLTASQGAASTSEFRIVGTKGDIRLDPAYEFAGKLRSFVTVDESTREHTYSKRDQFAPELLHFSACILEGKDPEPSGEEGLCDVRVLVAIQTAARTGQRVRLAPFERRSRPDVSLRMKRPPVGKISPIHAPSPSK